MIKSTSYWKEERESEFDKWENILSDPQEARLQGVPFEGQMAIIRRQKLLEEFKKNGIVETQKKGIEIMNTQQSQTLKPLSAYDEIHNRSDKLSLLLKGTDISAQRFIYAFQVEWNRNPKLQECSRDSLMETIMKCAEMGLLPGIGAYIIPYKTSAQMQPSLQGWLSLLWRSGNVENITTNLHRKGDEFSYSIEHTGTTLFHKPKLEMEGEILGAYAMITLKNHQIQFKYCNLKEINASRNASKNFQSKGPDSIWVKHFDQMATIVPLRKLARNIAPSLQEWHTDEHSEEPYAFNQGASLPEMLNVSQVETDSFKATSTQIDTLRAMCNNDQITTLLKWANINTIHDLSEKQANQTIARLHQLKNNEIKNNKIISDISIESDDIIEKEAESENKVLYGNISVPYVEIKNETFNEERAVQ